jgi:hypothetical protein
MVSKPEGEGGRSRVFPDVEIDPCLAIGLDGTAREKASPPHQPEGEQEKKRQVRRGIWGGIRYLLGGPISSVGVENITESASYIRGLTRSLRNGPQQDSRVHIYDDRSIDIEATAINEGRSVLEMRAMMGNRRLQTKRAVFCYMVGAFGFFLAWVWEAAHSSAYTRLPYVIVLCLICGIFCLSAFHNALVNWQIRTLRLGTWCEFINTNESWWPS